MYRTTTDSKDFRIKSYSADKTLIKLKRKQMTNNAKNNDDSKTIEVNVSVGNKVKIYKPSLVKNRLNKKRGKNKKVRFLDVEEPKKATFRERFSRFFHFLWQCTRTTVATALRKFESIYFSVWKINRFGKRK